MKAPFGKVALAVSVTVMSMVAAPVQAATVAPLLASGESRVVPGEYVVKLKDAAAPIEDAVRTATAHGGTVVTRFSTVFAGYGARLDAEALAAVRMDPRVEAVSPNQVYTGGGTQTGAGYHIDRIDQPALPLNGTYNYNHTGKGVNAYVIDSGVRATHQEFGARAANVHNTVWDGRTTDCHGHGTHVASEVGGRTFGVAKDVTIHAVRILNCNNSASTFEIISGMDWVAKNHKKPAVANMSIQSANGNSDYFMDQAAKGLIDSGVILVLIAGNFNNNRCTTSPKDPRAIITAASDKNDSRNTGSNASSYGSCVTLFAPGAVVTAAGIASDTSTAVKSGTSMAAPLVTGTIAKMLEVNPNLTMAQAKQAIVANATPGVLTNIGTGSPNLLLNSNMD